MSQDLRPPAGPGVALLTAAASGALLWTAFPPIHAGWIAPVAVAALTWSLLRQPLGRAALIGFVAGLTFFLPLLTWMQVIGWDATVGLACLMAGWFALQGMATGLVSRLPGWPVWIAGLWVLQEWLRGLVPWGGFPWGRLAFAQPETIMGRPAAVVGLSGVTFIVALVGTSGIAALLAARQGQWRRVFGWTAVLALLLAASAFASSPIKTPTTATVAVIQGGTPQTGMGAMDVRRAVLDNHVRETMALARAIGNGTEPRPDFVLWPENSSDLDPLALPEAAGLISMASRAVQVPILVGAIIEVPGHPDNVFNVGIVWSPTDGPGQTYAKRHPVPFGEYVPLRSLIAGLVGRFDRIPRDFLAGTNPGDLLINGLHIGDLICFEVAYDDVMQPLIEANPQLITVQTNNATYAGTAQPEQQLEITRMRAIESGRTVAVAATSGISAFISPDGSVTDRLVTGETGRIVRTILLAEGSTLAVVLGPLVTLGLNALIGIAILVAIVSAVRGRRRTPPKVDA